MDDTEQPQGVTEPVPITVLGHPFSVYVSAWSKESFCGGKVFHLLTCRTEIQGRTFVHRAQYEPEDLTKALFQQVTEDPNCAFRRVLECAFERHLKKIQDEPEPEGSFSVGLYDPSDGAVGALNVNTPEMQDKLSSMADRFPHTCPRCGGPAYVGATTVECAQNCGA